MVSEEIFSWAYLSICVSKRKIKKRRHSFRLLFYLFYGLFHFGMILQKGTFYLLYICAKGLCIEKWLDISHSDIHIWLHAYLPQTQASGNIQKWTKKTVTQYLFSFLCISFQVPVIFFLLSTLSIYINERHFLCLFLTSKRCKGW